MSTKTRFEEEAKGNSEMAYSSGVMWTRESGANQDVNEHHQTKDLGKTSCTGVFS